MQSVQWTLVMHRPKWNVDSEIKLCFSELTFTLEENKWNGDSEIKLCFNELTFTLVQIINLC